MLTCIVVDDESKSRESLKSLIENFCDDVVVKTTCQNGKEAIEAVYMHHPDIVFLDIQLQRETGFDILERIDKINFEIIFTTAYSEFAVKAFKFSAIDYLLKPIDINELRKAIGKVQKRKVGELNQRMELLVNAIRGNATRPSRLAIPASDGLVFVNIDQILYCEASGNYTNIHLDDNRKFVVSRTLKEYDDLLSEHDFFRIHNSYVINLNAIKKYIRGEGGQVIMINDKSLDVSKAKKKGFLEKIKMTE
ncbi:LytR/AlgR family response regulator transcription factor [Pseudochryseolinea flava]|uniref:DNA-binding response regulator n=1 Tax=Pseudochryseolinea flava TaxID=2059302 RepID=A0A364Y7J9_9BACT|nr:LytTR family DNA-binding domain-containing protein [Pseudochryseolinea flava]RAW02873.1 DNA-binding response regulator [Pseudochryseolinea flava]